MHKRLFIAVDIDDATGAQIARISAGVRDVVATHTKASWVPTDRMHLTLLFLGHVEEAVEQRISGVLASPIREAPFDVMFDGLGLFPGRGSPRVLWLGIREGLEHLRSVHRTVVARVGLDLARVGLDLSRALPTRDASFSPHLTLARFRDRVPRGKLAGITRIQASAGPSRIDRVTLYESRLSPASLDSRSGRPEDTRRAGPTYVPLAVASLQP